MKKIVIAFMAALLSFILAGCHTEEPQKENKGTHPVQTTVPAPTQPKTEQQETTVDPFEGESEIDFSDFETKPDVTEPVQTQPSETEPPEKPEPTAPAQPQPKPTDPEETQPEETQPEETEPPAPTAPTYESDGYHSQIVRP